MTEAHGDSDLETPVPEDGDLLGTAVDSVNVAFWTIVTRVTGLARIATVAAVLGPTYLGNLFQAANTLPNLAYEMLAGTLLVSVLVPSLVGHVDRRDVRATERLAGGFLGLVSVGFVVAAVVVVALGPLVLRGLSLAVPDASVVADQRRVGWPLLAMLMPQIVLYGVASTGAAVMNAHGRFALAAAAPALENLGVVATVGALGVLFPSELSLAGVHGPALLVLGLGTTGAVGLHAAAQWWGARRLGVSVRPRPGWRDPELRKPIRRMVPSAGYAALNSVRMVAILVMTNRVAGGVVAFQLALSFFYLPIALAARPIGVALLPRLTR
jgi:putative peptidoglycan lipid II flippase